jgi:hypothetical protein
VAQRSRNKIRRYDVAVVGSNLGIWNLGLASDFEIRISHFAPKTASNRTMTDVGRNSPKSGDFSYTSDARNGYASSQTGIRSDHAGGLTDRAMLVCYVGLGRHNERK